MTLIGNRLDNYYSNLCCDNIAFSNQHKKAYIYK